MSHLHSGAWEPRGSWEVHYSASRSPGGDVQPQGPVFSRCWLTGACTSRGFVLQALGRSSDLRGLPGAGSAPSGWAQCWGQGGSGKPALLFLCLRVSLCSFDLTWRMLHQ